MEVDVDAEVDDTKSKVSYSENNPLKNDILNEEKNKEKPTNEIPSDIANDVRKK